MAARVELTDGTAHDKFKKLAVGPKPQRREIGMPQRIEEYQACEQNRHDPNSQREPEHHQRREDQIEEHLEVQRPADLHQRTVVEWRIGADVGNEQQ